MAPYSSSSVMQYSQSSGSQNRFEKIIYTLFNAEIFAQLKLASTPHLVKYKVWIITGNFFSSDVLLEVRKVALLIKTHFRKNKILQNITTFGITVCDPGHSFFIFYCVLLSAGSLHIF